MATNILPTNVSGRRPIPNGVNAGGEAAHGAKFCVRHLRQYCLKYAPRTACFCDMWHSLYFHSAAHVEPLLACNYGIFLMRITQHCQVLWLAAL